MLRNVKVLFVIVIFLTIFSYTASAKNATAIRAASADAEGDTAAPVAELVSNAAVENASKQKDNAMKDIILLIDGEPQTLSTPLDTAGELIDSLPLGEDESYDYSLGIENRELIDGMQISLRLKKIVYTVQTVEIPFTESQRPNENMLVGESVVAQEGANGHKEETIREVYISGSLFNSFVESFAVIDEPVERIVEYGTKEPKNMVAGYEYKDVITVNATAYTAYSANARTATGIKPYEGCVSVDPRIIPLGTKLYVEGYGPAVAADTGGSIKGNKVDLYYDTYNECINFGRRNLKVYILVG